MPPHEDCVCVGPPARPRCARPGAWRSGAAVATAGPLARLGESRRGWKERAAGDSFLFPCKKPSTGMAGLAGGESIRSRKILPEPAGWAARGAGVGWGGRLLWGERGAGGGSSGMLRVGSLLVRLLGAPEEEEEDKAELMQQVPRGNPAGFVQPGDLQPQCCAYGGQIGLYQGWVRGWK